MKIMDFLNNRAASHALNRGLLPFRLSPAWAAGQPTCQRQWVLG
jgi:hypothetical protein